MTATTLFVLLFNIEFGISIFLMKLFVEFLASETTSQT